MIDPEVLLQGYRLGVFPMAMADGAIEWFSPDPRAILPLEKFHAPHTLERAVRDRKCTRLNSSHDQISYAVFCLKKKKKRVLFRSDRKSTRLNSRHDQISYAVFCLNKKNTQTHLSAVLTIPSPHLQHNYCGVAL